MADVVNLYGCMSQGKTKKEAVINAKKAIRAYMGALPKTSDNAEFYKETVATPVVAL